jgi:tetratricopeptide (TPR) repeat protein
MQQRALLLGIVMVLSLPAPGHTASPYEAMQRGNALYQAGQYEAAAQQYAIAAQVLPEVAEILFNQGDAFYKQQDYARALEYYTRALQTGVRPLQSRLTYNLGNVKYQQALEALRSAEDAVTPLRTAMAYYRDCLEIDPQYQEARYNLELAYLLFRQLTPPQAQEQRPAESQEPQPAQNQDQPSPQHTPQQQSQPQQQNASQQSQGQHAEQAGQPQASLAIGEGPLQPSPALEELSPEEAEQLLTTIHERAREADIRRQQWRRAGIHNPQVDKDW